MVYVIGSHPVKDFDTWKPYFDGNQDRAKKQGIQIQKLFRDVNDPNLVYFLFTAPSAEQFMDFVHDPVLAPLMQQAGVLAPPEFHVLNEVE